MTQPASRDSLHWIAGIFDAALKVNIRVEHRAIRSIRLHAQMPYATSQELQRYFNGHYHKNTWIANPRDQRRIAMTMLKLVRDPILCEKLRIVVRFRLSRHGFTSAFNRAIPESVMELRRRLAVEFGRLESYEKQLANRDEVRDTSKTPVMNGPTRKDHNGATFSKA